MVNEKIQNIFRVGYPITSIVTGIVLVSQVITAILFSNQLQLDTKNTAELSSMVQGFNISYAILSLVCCVCVIIFSVTNIALGSLKILNLKSFINSKRFYLCPTVNVFILTEIYSGGSLQFICNVLDLVNPILKIH